MHGIDVGGRGVLLALFQQETCSEIMACNETFQGNFLILKLKPFKLKEAEK